MHEALLIVASALTTIIETVAIVAVMVSVCWGLAPVASFALGRVSRPTLNEVRNRLGRGLVLSLELLIAADLMRSVLVPTLTDVVVLGLITLIRIALGLSLEYELRFEPASTQQSPSAGRPGEDDG